LLVSQQKIVPMTNIKIFFKYIEHTATYTDSNLLKFLNLSFFVRYYKSLKLNDKNACETNSWNVLLTEKLNKCHNLVNFSDYYKTITRLLLYYIVTIQSFF